MAYSETPMKGNAMLKKIKNIDPKTIFVAKVVAARIVLPIAATTIVYVIANKIEKKIDAED